MLDETHKLSRVFAARHDMQQELNLLLITHPEDLPLPASKPFRPDPERERLRVNTLNPRLLTEANEDCLRSHRKDLMRSFVLTRRAALA